MRLHSLSHSRDGWHYRIVEVPLWRHIVAETTENVMAAVGHPCCKWWWARRLMSNVMNVEWSAEKQIALIPLTEEEAATFPERAAFTYLDE